MTASDAADHRARQVAARIAILLREIERALPAAVGDHDGLERDDQAGRRRAAASRSRRRCAVPP